MLGYFSQNDMMHLLEMLDMLTDVCSARSEIGHVVRITYG